MTNYLNESDLQAPDKPKYLDEKELFSAPKGYLDEDELFGRKKERSLAGDVAVNIGRGIADTGELAGQALKTAGAEKAGQWLVDKSKAAQDSKALAPDASEQEGEGFVKRGVMGGIRSFMPSLASAGSGALAGGAVGTAIGGPVGTVAGGIVGAGLGALGLFGAGVYGKEKDAYLEKNPDDTLGAHRYALGQAAIEGGIEAVATPIEILAGLATGGTGKTLTQPVKQTVKQLLRVGPKQIAKNYAKTIGIETGTEMLQSGLGNEWAKKYGMAEGATQEAILESIIPAVTMSLLFGTGVQGYNLNERRKIKNAIESGEADPTQRAEAADFVHRELLKDDAELAEAWKNYSQAAIDSGQDIDIDEDFANYASAKIEAEKTGAGPIQKAADQAPPVGIDAIPSMGEVPEFTDNTETDIDRERLGATSVAAVREEHGEKVAAQVRKAKANGESITIEEAKKRAEPPKIDKKQERKDLGITRPQQRLLDLLRAKGKPSRLLDVKMDEPNQKAMNGLIQKGLVQRNENGTYEIGGTVDTSASEQRDLMYQFAETAQDVQDQADARTRAYRFEQMPGELEWQRQEQAAREYNQGKNVKRSEDAHLFPAFDKMVEEMKGGYVSRSAQNQYGETSPTVSANPDWIKQRTVKEYNKRTGSDISISKEDVQTIFNKVKNNRPLTNLQQKQYDYLRSVAEKKINSDTELVRDNEFANIEKKGFTLQEPETIAVGDLQKGEEIVVVDDNGIPDVLTNKGRDKDGDIILQDGITMRVDEFDTVDVIGRRMTDKAKFENQQRQAASQEVPEGETQAQPAPAKSAPIIEEKPTDDAKPADTGEQSSKTVSQPVQTEQTAQNEQPSDLPSVGTEPSSKAAPATPPPKAEGGQRSESSSSSKIDDFGEKIGGAKKDVWASFKDKMGEVPDADIASEPLSKIWPKPDYQAMIDGGMDKGVVALARALRDAIPNKPRKRVARWAELVKGLRDIATSVVGQTVSVAETRKLIRESKNADIGAILDQADLYLEVGHGKSLAGIRVSAGQYSMLNGVEYNPAKTIWTVEQQAKKTAFSSWPRILAQGNTKEDAIADFKKKYEQLEINKPAERQVTFDIYSYRDKGKPGFYVGKKIGRNHIDIAGPFDTVKEARQYKNDNHDTLIDRLNKFKEIPRERRDTNEPRVGEDMRGGEDVTPEMFSEAFGFRGVEFGNWVEQKKRQEDLNNAYDSLMDMAAVIGINPNAISLNGQLGLAFGARGSGGKDAAAAHYEPGKMVINLTKKSGAGSLGHEWWHAVDNYFARMRKGHDGSYMTDALDVSLSAKGSPYQHKGEVRKEMVDAFGAVMRAIRGTAMKARATVLDRKRTKQYWTTKTEMSARAFESYLISKLHDQGASNDYLANIVDEKTWKAAESLGFELDDSYSYPTAGEIPAIRGAFDHFFSTIESRETDTGIELYAPEAQPRTVWTENFPDAVLMAEYGAAQKHPDYRAAKENGDIGAAFRLVKSLISRSGINKIKSIVSKGNATIVTPVISEERHGKNMIPRAYADILADEIGATADVDIIHINKVGRGGADGFHRLAAQPIFSGQVVSGREYIIVDDSLAQGGTLASLKGYIESNGGKVVLFTALTGKQYSARIVPKRETLIALRKKYPALEEYWNEEFGYDFSRLTQSEARYILKLKGQDANSIRDRISTLRESQGAPENESPDSKGQGAVTGRTTLGALLKTAKRSRTITGKLAQLMSDFIPASKLDIPVIINPKAKSFSYNPQTNTITVRNPEQYSTSLHEIVHAVTVRELNSGTREAREALRKIKALMRNVAPELVKRNLISAELLSQVRDAKTSQAFKQMYPDSATNQYAYALLNEYEFLAQAFSSKEVQSILKDIRVERKGALVRAWDAFVDTVMRVLGIEATHKDAFGEVVSIVAELSQMEAGKAGKGTMEAAAWHGTPYRGIKKFSLDKIGTGEGAQAYGYGLYFTDKKEIANWYKEGTTRVKDFYIDGKIDSGSTRDRASIALYKNKGNKRSALEQLKMYAGVSPEYYKDVIEYIENDLPIGKVEERGGGLYKVEIPDDDVLLHWDKPLSKQPEKVREALDTIIEAITGVPGEAMDTITNGADFYHALAKVRENGLDAIGFRGGRVASSQEQRAASEYLNSLGIKGIKYLDGTSRGKGEGSYNYVIFDDSAIEILEELYSPDSFAVDESVPLSAAMQRIQNLPAFKKWFGDSVVTVDGKPGSDPLVVYHGTNKDFSIFSKGVFGFHFGSSEQANNRAATNGIAEWRGGTGSKGRAVYPVYLSIKNPLRTLDAFGESGDKPVFLTNNLRKQGFVLNDGLSWEEVMEAIKKAGYDGIVYNNRSEGAGDSYIAFSPTQIKSIYNPGKWSTTNPDIMEAPEEAAQPPAKSRGGIIKQTLSDVLDTSYMKKRLADIKFIEKIFSSPDWTFRKSPAAWRLLNAQYDRMEDKHTLEKYLIGDFVQVFKEASKKFKTDYASAKKYLLEKDRTGETFRLQRFSGFKVYDPDGKFVGNAETQVAAYELSDAAWKMHKKTAPETKRLKKDYRIDQGVWFHLVNEKGRTVETHTDEAAAVIDMMDREGQKMKKDGYSERAVNLVRSYREMTNRAFDKMVADLRKVQEETKEAGLDEPTVSVVDETKRWGVYEGNKLVASFQTKEDAQQAGGRKHTIRMHRDAEIRKELKLSEVIAQIADLRGSYFARQRPRGAVIVRAEKGTDKVLLKTDMLMVGDKYIDFETGAELKRPEGGKPLFNWLMGNVPGTVARQMRQLKAKGYEITIEKDTAMPESVFDVAKLSSSIASILDEAQKKARGGADKAAVAEISKIITANVADVFKARGYLSSRLKRQEDYWLGFEEDPLLSGTQYIRGLAAGIAKKEAAKKMLNIITGRDITYNEWKEDNPTGTPDEYQEFVEKRKIDPTETPEIYREAMSFTRDMLRNQERIDRILGTMQGLAVIKFLGFRISSAAVNATNMVQAVPATISAQTGATMRGALRGVSYAATQYGKLISGKGTMSAEDRAIYQEIIDRGWDQAQYNKEAAEILMSRFGRAFDTFSEWSMKMFGAVEKANRATTIFAAYKELKRNQNKNRNTPNDTTLDNELLLKARAISNDAHGVYGAATRPTWARGAWNPLRLPFTFAKFSQNYVMNMVKMGLDGHHKQAAYMLLSPGILAGSGATLATPVIVALAKALGLGGDDPEEEFYQWVEDNFGSDRFARHGIAGLAGVNLKGSLQINTPMPTRLSELFGAPQAIVMDTIKGIDHYRKGEFYKGTEALLPTAVGTAFKAVRESTEGLSTGNYSPVYYGDDPVKADGLDATLRFLSFNPARISGIREKQWSERKVEQKYTERRTEIYAKLKRNYFFGSGDRAEIMKEVSRYNEMVKASGMRWIPLITAQSIRSNLRRASRPSKKERMRE